MRKTIILAGAACALAASLAPAGAWADDRRGRHCDNDSDEAAIAGALIGGLLGGAVGSGSAGYGNEGEGAVIGALLGAGLGAVAGSELADDDCGRRRGRSYNNRRYDNVIGYGSGYGGRNPVYNVGRQYPTYGNGYPVYDNRGYDRGRDNRRYDGRRDDRRYDNRRHDDRRYDRSRYEDNSRARVVAQQNYGRIVSPRIGERRVQGGRHQEWDGARWRTWDGRAWR